MITDRRIIRPSLDREFRIDVSRHRESRIASDLHDELISKLTVLTYALQTNNEKVKPVELLGDSIKIARRITHDLRPPMLEETTLDELVEDFILPLKNLISVALLKI